MGIQFKTVRIPWNKGKKGSQVAWNKGKVGIYSSDTLKKMSDAKRKHPTLTMNCKNCLKDFVTKNHYTYVQLSGGNGPQFCSRKCYFDFRETNRDKFYKKCLNRIYQIICKECGNKKQTTSTRKPVFCDNRCYLNWAKKNNTWPKKATEHARLVNTGRPSPFKGTKNPAHSLKMKGRPSANKGKPVSEEMKLRISNTLKGRYQGSLSHNWRGGISQLSKKIRNLRQYKYWKRAVYTEHGNICVECFKDGLSIEADHIKPFSEILREFLKEYSQFSPFEDKETLLRLAETYKPFWDVSNGRTLCIDCHIKTETYGGRCRNLNTRQKNEGQ